MIKALRFTFLWLFACTIIFSCSEEKEPEPEPIPEDTRTTREYLASKARKQILTFDANSTLRIVTEKGLIIEANPNVWKDDKSGATITGSIQLEVSDFSSNKDFILNHVGSINPYMNIYNKIIRFERGFRISPTQEGKHLSGKLTLKVPLKDPLIIAGNRAQLVFCAESTDPEGQ